MHYYLYLFSFSGFLPLASYSLIFVSSYYPFIMTFTSKNKLCSIELPFVGLDARLTESLIFFLSTFYNDLNLARCTRS